MNPNAIACTGAAASSSAAASTCGGAANARTGARAIVEAITPPAAIAPNGTRAAWIGHPRGRHRLQLGLRSDIGMGGEYADPHGRVPSVRLPAAIRRAHRGTSEYHRDDIYSI